MLEFGLSHRLKESISALINVRTSRSLRIGYAYDHTLTGLGEFSSGSHEVLYSLILILKSLKLDLQDISNIKNTIMKKYNQIIFLFLFSFSVIQAQTKETKDAKHTYKVTNLQGINSINSDFGVTEFGNSILFLQ